MWLSLRVLLSHPSAQTRPNFTSNFNVWVTDILIDMCGAYQLFSCLTVVIVLPTLVQKSLQCSCRDMCSIQQPQWNQEADQGCRLTLISLSLHFVKSEAAGCRMNFSSARRQHKFYLEIASHASYLLTVSDGSKSSKSGSSKTSAGPDS